MKRVFNLLTFVALAMLSFAMVACNDNPDVDKSGIQSNPVEIDGLGGNVAVAYVVTGGDASQLEVSCDVEWLHDFVVDTSIIRCQADANTTKAARVATLTLSCGALPSIEVTVTQLAADVDFLIDITEITPYTCHVTYTPVNHDGSYLFLVVEKDTLESYIVTDALDEWCQGDIEWLTGQAEYNGMTLEEFLPEAKMLFSVFPDPVSIDYTTLDAETDYYAYCYGMEADGTITTPMYFKEFSTRIVQSVDMEFELTVEDVEANAATITVTPSNNEEYYFWTYISAMDYAIYDDNAVMTNMIANILATVEYGEATMEELLHQGPSSQRPKSLWSGTKYHVIAWGMDLKGAPTTPPINIGSFVTASSAVEDDCTFAISCPEVTQTDMLINVKPSKSTTRYMICPVEETICGAYGDEQMAQRLINMEQGRFDESFYGEGVDWSNAEWIFSGEQTKWGRADLDWTFEAGKSYRIYVFGVDANGNRTTAVARHDQQAAAGERSDMTFEVELIENVWNYPVIRVTPSNNNEFWLSCMMKSEYVDLYRNGDGTINEEEMMHMLDHEYFDGDAKYYAKQGEREDTYYWASESEYTLLLCGWSGSNTTPFFEFKFTTPAIPWGESEAGVEVEYKLFDGAALVEMDMFTWAGYEDNCVVYIEYTPNEQAAHWYGGVWMPESNYADNGGVDHLVALLRNPDVSHVDRYSGMYRGVWFDDTFSISWFAEDADGRLGQWHYEEFTPTREGDGYNMDEPYDFWTNPKANSAILTFKK